jgi:hypothetical protein
MLRAGQRQANRYWNSLPPQPLDISSARTHSSRELSERRETVGWNPSPRDCHKNSDQYAMENVGHRSVRGWLIFDDSDIGRYRFLAHSVVEGSDGKLFKGVTPSRCCTTRKYPTCLTPYPLPDVSVQLLLPRH